MTGPAVSVIIIVYNGAAFLEEALSSVFSQTASDYEVLIVDDGSTDDSRTIAERWRAVHVERLTVLRHPGGQNRGMSASRNLGLANARGEFVAFLDADDVWLPSKLEEQLAIMRREPSTGLVYGRALIWRSWSDASANEDFYYELGVEPDKLYAPPQLFMRQLRNVDQTPTTSGTMLRRTLIDEVGGFEPIFRGMFEDQVFFAKALLSAPAYVSEATWFRYRQHPGSATAQSAAAGADHRARLNFLRWLARYLSDHARGPEARKAVELAIRQTVRDHGRHRARRALLKLRRPWLLFR